jgi:serine/threonine protein kinase
MATTITSPNGNTFKEVSLLGIGAFGTVKLCTHTTAPHAQATPAKCCVLKKVKLARQSPKERAGSVQELALMLQMRHRNLVQGIDAWLEGKHTACLAMQHCVGGDLTAVLAARKRCYIHEPDVCIMLVQVRTRASCISYLLSVLQLL